MTRRLVIAVAAVALLALGSTSAQASAVTDWNAITQVMVGIVQAAVFDAANAIEGGYTPYGGAIDAPTGASPDAAVATAAHQVAVQLAPGRQVSLDTPYAAYLAGLPNGPAKDAASRSARRRRRT